MLTSLLPSSSTRVVIFGFQHYAHLAWKTNGEIVAFWKKVFLIMEWLPISWAQTWKSSIGHFPELWYSGRSWVSFNPGTILSPSHLNFSMVAISADLPLSSSSNAFPTLKCFHFFKSFQTSQLHEILCDPSLNNSLGGVFQDFSKFLIFIPFGTLES